MLDMIYNPRDWFWIIGGDESRAWWSKTRAYVTQWPADRVTRIGTVAELRDVLAAAGVLVTQITKKQFCKLCLSRGYMTAAQAKAIAQTNTLPTAVLNYISTLPADEQDATLIDMYDGAYSRDNAVVIWFLTGRGLDEAGIDDFFAEAKAL